MAKRQKTGGGSRKGIPNKITSDVREMVLRALQAAGGEDYLKRQAIAQPAAFMALVGKTLPKNLKIDAAGSLTVTVLTGVPTPE
jgi:hypothetical protein